MVDRESLEKQIVDVLKPSMSSTPCYYCKQPFGTTSCVTCRAKMIAAFIVDMNDKANGFDSMPPQEFERQALIEEIFGKIKSVVTTQREEACKKSIIAYCDRHEDDYYKYDYAANRLSSILDDIEKIKKDYI